jgi:predicted negative regulator of RcsB-dependent stress response
MSSESTVSTRGLEFLAWLEMNKTRLIVGTAVFAILLASFVIHRWRVAEREQLASAALIRVQSTVASDQEVREPAADDYLRIASEHRRTEAGARAKLFAAEAFFRDGRYAESQAQFQAFQEAHPLNPLASTAAFGVAACLDALGKPDEAYQAYQQVVSRHANSALASQAKLAMADLYVARGEPAQALRLYEELQVTAWARSAAERREQLLVQHPELSGMDEMFRVPEVTMPVTGEGLERLEVAEPSPVAE